MNNPEIEAITRRYGELRYQLIPYTYTLAREARDTGMPPMRALWLHYPEDERARGVGSEYLWGRDLLVAPVFTQGAETREVYLPAGDWYDWWTRERLQGGRAVTREVDLSIMPIYARAGAVIPFDPVRQYMDEAVDQPTTIKVFRGADGEFTMYEDDGISLDYLQGRGTWTRFTWDDARARLSIEPGAPPGAVNILPESPTYLVELLPGAETRTVRYEGVRGRGGVLNGGGPARRAARLNRPPGRGNTRTWFAHSSHIAVSRAISPGYRAARSTVSVRSSRVS